MGAGSHFGREIVKGLAPSRQPSLNTFHNYYFTPLGEIIAFEANSCACPLDAL
jgi:hypothetical protein